MHKFILKLPVGSILKWLLGNVKGKLFLELCDFYCRYDPQEDIWLELSPMLKARALAGCVVYRDKIYVIGIVCGNCTHKPFNDRRPFISKFSVINYNLIIVAFVSQSVSISTTVHVFPVELHTQDHPQDSYKVFLTVRLS